MSDAPEPITVTVSHRLGRDGAKARIDSGLDAIRGEVGPSVGKMDYTWDGYRLDFRVSALLQMITGAIEVYDDFVKIELGLPRLLHLLVGNIGARIKDRAALLLEAPKGKD